ncbi:MAG: succinate dehydrogenase flavoprotein subunit [Deltaproteobacteria bacterium]|nr:succinate dehydrogenase flavoprotein subunit [Deltaproteobacteria bacterium]
MRTANILVIGGGLAGQMAALAAAEQNCRVDVLSLVPLRRSHSVCAQGGINAAANPKAQGDGPWVHFEDTIRGGDYLANQGPVKRMCEAAPGIVRLLDRMGAAFHRTPEGFLDFRLFDGSKHRRTAYAGATTGQQILYALDEQVRRYEAAGMIRKFEGWEFLSAALDGNGSCRGAVAVDLASGEVRAFPAGAVVVATGGLGALFGRSTNSLLNTGAAAGALYGQGAIYANGEFIQVHPTAIPGPDKMRLISGSALAEGARIWVPRNGKRWYFLEEKFPAYGNLVARDLAVREIHDVCCRQGLGVGGELKVYLDLTELPKDVLEVKLAGLVQLYRRFMREDPAVVPMKVSPAVHYSMGGLWIDPQQMTSIPGLFAAGECEYQYHGANRLGGNSLLSCLHGGMVAGRSAGAWADGAHGDAGAGLQAEVVRQEAWLGSVASMQGRENPFRLHEELGRAMTEQVTVVRTNAGLDAALEKIQELKERWDDIAVCDPAKGTNQSASFVRQLHHMLELAHVIALGARLREESRGSHYKVDFPERDDRFLKTTLARFTPDGPRIEYGEVDLQFLAPRPRTDEEAGP